jgi:hypothetical protein
MISNVLPSSLPFCILSFMASFIFYWTPDIKGKLIDFDCTTRNAGGNPGRGLQMMREAAKWATRKQASMTINNEQIGNSFSRDQNGNIFPLPSMGNRTRSSETTGNQVTIDGDIRGFQG